MAVRIRFFLFFLPLLTSSLFAATSHKKGRFRMVVEDVTYKAYQLDVLNFNVTATNATFDLNFQIFKTFDPIFFIKLDVFRNGKTANVAKQSLDFCNAMNPPSPLGIIFKVIVEKGSTTDLSCPLKPGIHAVKNCDIPLSRFFGLLPALPFKLFIDIMDKKTRKVLGKNTAVGKVEHI